MIDMPVALPVRTHIREYEIQELVGSGGFGFVYRATDHMLQRSVALKEYFPASIATRGEGGLVQSRLAAQNGIYKRGLESFLTEARVLAQFDDPAVVKVHFFWEQDGTAYMVMPFYDGITLRGFVRHHRDLITVEWLKAFILRITDVLGRLHEAGTFHRDLSPENILILESGGLVLLDFGSSRQVLAGLTGGSEVVLKPGYAPIEQYLADSTFKQGPWTDLYGLGAVLHFLLEGKAPPASINRMQQDVYQMLIGKRDIYPDVPQKILTGIDHCLAVQPDRRPQSIAKLKELFAIAPESVVDGFDLYQGVAKSAEFSAANTTALHEENDLTIPLDPIVMMLPDVESGMSAAAQPLPSIDQPLSAADPAGTSELPIDSTVPPSPHAPATASVVSHVNSSPLRARKMQVGLGLGAFVLLSSIGLWLYLSISPPWKRPVMASQTVQLKPTSSLDVAALAGNANAGLGALSVPEKTEPKREMPTPRDVPVSAESAAANSTFSMPIKGAAVPATKQSDPVRLPANLQPDPVTAHAKTAGDVAVAVPQLPAAGVLRLSIRPWGKLSVNGRPRGASPPVNQLKLAPGKYQIEISNPGFPSYTRELEVTPGATTVIKHNFE